MWFGHLPADAVPVGKLRIGHQVPDETEVEDTYRVTVALDVARVPDGRYSVWVCAPGRGGNGCLIGFGDLVYGRLIVARGTGDDLAVGTRSSAALAQLRRPTPTSCPYTPGLAPVRVHKTAAASQSR